MTVVSGAKFSSVVVPCFQCVAMRMFCNMEVNSQLDLFLLVVLELRTSYDIHDLYKDI